MTREQYVRKFIEEHCNPEEERTVDGLKRLLDLAKSDEILNNSQILIVQIYTKSSH